MLVIDPNIQPPFIGFKIIHPVGNRLTESLVDKIVRPRFYRLPFFTVFLTNIAEITEPSLFFKQHGLFFRIDGNGRLIGIQVFFDGFIDVQKLFISVGVVATFTRFAIGL